MARKLVNIPHAHTNFQKTVMERIEKDGVCPFCLEHFLKYHTKPILKEGAHWILTENFQPYEGCRHHFLLVHKTHIERFDELAPEAQIELFVMLKHAKDTHGIAGGVILMRWGDTDLTGGTVAHLHAHLICGHQKDDAQKEQERIMTMVGYHK